MRPRRTCLGCMEPDDKDSLVRLAARDGSVVVDFAAREKGRGAYLHLRRECLERFLKSKVRTFRSLGRAIDAKQRRAIAEAVAGAGAASASWNNLVR